METLPSRATMSPSSVLTSGLTSTSVASSVVDVPQFADDVGDGRLVGLVEAGRVDDFGSLGCVDADVGVDGDPGQGFGALDGEGLDVHAALLAAHREVGAVCAVQQDREVVLLRDLGALGDHDRLDRVALDVHPEDGLGRLGSSLGALDDLDATGLAATAGLDLGLDDDDTAALGPDPLSGSLRFLGRAGDLAGQHGDPVRLEDVACLVLVQIHGRPSSSSKGPDLPGTARFHADPGGSFGL